LIFFLLIFFLLCSSFFSLSLLWLFPPLLLHLSILINIVRSLTSKLSSNIFSFRLLYTASICCVSLRSQCIVGTAWSRSWLRATKIIIYGLCQSGFLASNSQQKLCSGKWIFDSNLSKFNDFRCCKFVRFPLDILCI
jgi:hypothetical protein